MKPAVHREYSLRRFNTFGVDACARLFTEVATDEQLRWAVALADRQSLPLVMLGGGSNVLLTQDLDSLVVHTISRGIRVVDDSVHQVLVEAEAGERWHNVVLWSLQRDLAGLENLSLIPGTVGAAPIQNIGAYGVELKDVFAGLIALDRQTGAVRSFSIEDCAFAYRDSCFKREPGRWLILRVRLRLSRIPDLKLDYGPVREQLRLAGITQPTPVDVSRIICAIRRKKLPDPRQLGNAGSFFKNPSVSRQQSLSLLAQYPAMPNYPQPEGRVKLAAAWLIEAAGWKGYRQGSVGVHEHQAVVLVNYGDGTGRQILNLAERIRQDIRQRFDIDLEIEPTIY